MPTGVRPAVAVSSFLISASFALANDPGANLVTKLFIDACLPNMGHPEKVRAWAEANRLQPVTNPAALGVFVGPGGKGAAWAVPSNTGSFALSLKGTTEACAAWARAADPQEVEAKFKTLVEGVKRPGLELRVDQDKTTPTPFGEAHALVYNVTAVGAHAGFEFTMLTAERVGGAFQASLQVAQATSR